MTNIVVFREAPLVGSPEGKKLQVKTWNEIIELLRKHVPRIDEILAA